MQFKNKAIYLIFYLILDIVNALNWLIKTQSAFGGSALRGGPFSENKNPIGHAIGTYWHSTTKQAVAKRQIVTEPAFIFIYCQV
jgi:hypothetical protein